MAEHKTQPQLYGIIFAALVGLTVLTLLLAGVELGAMHALVGLAIAGTKATLIVLFFMHALHGSRLTWLVAGASILFLALLLLMTLGDYMTRTWAL
jgi:cytochrome c oxidase subunit IV